MKDIDFVNHWPKEKQDEVYAVKWFLDNQQTSFELSPPNIDHSPAEPADIWVKDINLKFQVVVSDFELYERLGKSQPDADGIKMVPMPSRNKSDVFREFVIKPLQKKSKYGASAKGIILLIKTPFDPPWIERDIELQRALGYQKELNKLGFDSIYLVFSNKNVLIFP